MREQFKAPEVYWDYRYELSSEQIQQLLTPDGEMELYDELWEMNIDYIIDLEVESTKEIIREFEDEILEHTPEFEEIEDLLDDYDFIDYIRQELDVCVDLNLKDLMRNSRDEVFFYSTGASISDYLTDFDERVEEVREALHIDPAEEKLMDEIRECVANASYGGELVIYFNLDAAEIQDAIKAKSINFYNFHFAIIDTMNGSGWMGQAVKHRLTLPFTSDNMYYERSIHYNFTFEVCGMSSDWCRDTVVEFLETEVEGEIETSGQKAHMEEEKRLDAIFKSGKCTFGDMKYTRHRNTTYINDFPCGNKCLDCGTFWID